MIHTSRHKIATKIPPTSLAFIEEKTNQPMRFYKNSKFLFLKIKTENMQIRKYIQPSTIVISHNTLYFVEGI